MAVFNLFSKRHTATPATLTYDAIPPTLRHQIVAILCDAFGIVPDPMREFRAILEREHPLVRFEVERGDGRFVGAPPIPFQFITSGVLDECLDAVEAGFWIVNGMMRKVDPQVARQLKVVARPDDAIAELNARFLASGVGYQFNADLNELVRVDSEHLQEEAVAPAARLLMAPGFEGPRDEFEQAHAHHRAGNGKDAIAWAVKAFESTAKAICDARKWKYDAKRATMKDLLPALWMNGLIPSDLESHFTGLRTALESGLPTIGNRMARHGQGARVRGMDDHVVALGMHLCAAAIVFLVEAHRAKP